MRRTTTLLVLLALLGTAPLAVAKPSRAAEYKVKAGVLFNLGKYVTWPDSAFADTEKQKAPFVIGILGKSQFDPEFFKRASQQKVQGRKLVFRTVRTAQAGRSCHVLFVCESEKSRVDAILRALKGSKALTVGETDRFAHKGGMVNMRLVGRRVKLEFNVRAAKASGLRIDPKLLKLGTRVDKR